MDASVPKYRRAFAPLVAALMLALAGCAPMPTDIPERPGVDPGAAPRAPVYEPSRSGLPPPVYDPSRGSAPPPMVADRGRTSASLYFYPERNQDDARQDRDRYECYRWAVGQTGFDPGMTAVREVPPPARRAPPPPPGVSERADVGAGAVTGAVVGTVLSGRHHGAQGAVLGAIFGAMIGAAASDNRQRVDSQAEARAQARDAARAEQAERPMNDFRRAMTACMEGRGYRVR
jgi:hypothetical protein